MAVAGELLPPLGKIGHPLQRIIKVEDNKFDNLIPEIQKKLMESYMEILRSYPVFKEDVDTSPLLNMTISSFVGSLINILDIIKKQTIGEVQLIQNIELTKASIIKAIDDLPFVRKIEFF